MKLTTTHLLSIFTQITIKVKYCLNIFLDKAGFVELDRSYDFDAFYCCSF